MFLIDHIAYTNRLRNTHPMEKFIFSMVSMVIVLLSWGPAVPLMIFFIMTFLILFRAGVRVKDYTKLLLVPLLFIMVSILTMILIIKSESFESLLSIEISGLHMGITGESLDTGLKIFLRSMSTISCFYFFILTTPLVDIEYILIKMRVPSYFREIFILVYRFIFIIFEISQNIYLSQKSRSGYIKLGSAYHSTGFLISSVLVKSLNYGEKSHQALLSRGYTGELKVIRKQYRTSLLNWELIALAVTVLITVEIGLR